MNDDRDPDRAYLTRWREALQHPLDAERLDALRELVSAIEADEAAQPSRLASLCRELGLGAEAKRVLASVLVDRRSRRTGLDLACLAWLTDEARLDAAAVMRELDVLERLALVRRLDAIDGLDDGRSDLDARRYAAGPGLAELARVARRIRPPSDPTRARRPRAERASDPELPPPPFLLARWELERWAICFRTRLASHQWIAGHHDAYKEFVGNTARTVDVAALDALAAEAERLDDELTALRADGPTVLEHVERTFDVSHAHARVLLYYFVADVLDAGLPAYGRNLLNAIGPTGLEPIAIHELLGSMSPLVRRGLLSVIHQGSSLYTTSFSLTAAAHARIDVDPSARPPAEGPPPSLDDAIGELRDARVALSDVILPASTHEALLDALALLDPAMQAMVPAGTRARLLYKGKGTTLLFEGPPGTGKTMAAEAIARHLGRPMYVARVDRIEDYLLGNSQKNVVRLFDEASAANAVLLLDEADALVASRTAVHQAWDQHRNTMVNLFLTAVEEHQGVVILTTNLAINLDPALERRLTARIRFGVPGLAERERLWERYLPDDIPVRGELDVRALARRYPMSGARIRNAVLSAVRKELRRRVGVGGEARPLELMADDLVTSAAEELRAAHRDRFGRDDGADSGDVGDLRTPQRDLASIVLPPAMIARLREALVALSPAARTLFESAAFLDAFRTGRGTVLLFDGPPGTGKTATAEAVAGELGRSMYVVTPERVLSKWHGQSERALARVFDEADAVEAVLVIDEADSLLEARVDAGEWGARTGNNMVNLLLRRLEESSGIAILITNRAARLDPALERRLSARLTFELPEPAAAAEILRRHLPDGVSLAPDVDLDALVREHRLSGGHLRNALLTAIRRMVLRDPSARTLDRATLEQALRETRASDAPRPVGFRAGA